VANFLSNKNQKKTITAFQQKIKSIKKVMALTAQIPIQYDKPQIKAELEL
jgi:hypothetical protein